MANQINFSIFKNHTFTANFIDVDVSGTPIVRSSFSGEITIPCDENNILGIPIQISVINSTIGKNQLQILDTDIPNDIRTGIYLFKISGINSTNGNNELILFGNVRIRVY